MRTNIFRGVFGGVSNPGEWGDPESKTLSSTGVLILDGPGYYLVDTYGAAASDDLASITGLDWR